MTKRRPEAVATMGPMPEVQPFVEMFARLPDPRVHRTRVHSLESILFLCLCGVICGANDVVAIQRFGDARRDFLEELVPFPGGIPSHDTIGRVLSKLNPVAFEEMFVTWMRAVAKATDGDVVAIDGKTLRRALDAAKPNVFVHMVSAWSTCNGVVLGQVATSEHSNEIPAIPKLLRLLQMKNCLVTIDAMGCQTDIVDEIVQAGGDYLISVKENQPKLSAAVVKAFEQQLESRRKWSKADHVIREETSHGRVESRRCRVIDVDDSFPEQAKWTNLKKLVLVERSSTSKGVITGGMRIFISSRATLTADQALDAVRGHWEIENKLHWTLDVAFREDDTRVRAENAAENLAVVRHVALNLLRNVKNSKVGVKNRRLEAGWSNAFLAKVLTSLED